MIIFNVRFEKPDIFIFCNASGETGVFFITNHLKNIFKKILLRNESEIRAVNYHARVEKDDPELVIAIYHVKYMGFKQFKSALWNETNRELTVPDADLCPDSEIVFVLRTIKSTGKRIQKVYEMCSRDANPLKKDVTVKYQKYL